jgi:hypothetical protein
VKWTKKFKFCIKATTFHTPTCCLAYICNGVSWSGINEIKTVWKRKKNTRTAPLLNLLFSPSRGRAVQLSKYVNFYYFNEFFLRFQILTKIQFFDVFCGKITKDKIFFAQHNIITGTKSKSVVQMKKTCGKNLKFEVQGRDHN